MKSLITHPEAKTITGLFGYETTKDIPKDNLTLLALISIGLALNVATQEQQAAIILTMQALCAEEVNSSLTVLQYIEKQSEQRRTAFASAVIQITE